MSSMPPPVPGAGKPTPGPSPRNWLQRNLKWVLPLAVVALLGGWVLLSWGGYYKITGVLRDSEPYRLAMARAGADPQLQAALGQPIKASPFLLGNFSHTAGGRQISMEIRLSGPHGKAKYSVAARRSGDAPWCYDVLAIRLPGRPEPLDLRTDAEKGWALSGQCE